MYSNNRWFTSILFILMTTFLVACEPSGVKDAPTSGSVPKEIQILSTLNQVSYIGSEHPLIKILVVDENLKPVPNTSVTLITNSGTAALVSSQTNSLGEAYIRWSFGQVSGQFQLTIAAEKNLYSFSRTIYMNLLPTSVSALNCSITGTSSIPADGNSQSTVTITLRDANGYAVQGETPLFSATDSGLDNVYGGCSPSDENGISFCTLRSSTAETKQLRLLSPARVDGDSVVFNSTTILSSLRFTSQPIANTTDSNFSTQPIVTAYYQDGSVASDVNSSVTLSAFSGTNCTGALAASTISGNLTQSLLGGVATFSGLKPLKTNIRSLKASLGSLTVCSRYFNVNPGNPANITVSSGNNQTGVVHTTLAPLSVIVTDANQNIVPYASVNWTILSGGGSLSTVTTTTNTLGISSSNLTLGTISGVNTVKASLPATTTNITFSATATPAAAATVTVSTGDGQSAPAATATALPLSVIVKDIYLNPVTGATITWSVLSGGGSLTTYSTTTDTSGIASTQLTVGQIIGSNTVSAALVGTTSITTFSATTTAGAATSITLSGGQSQTSTVGTTLTSAFSVVAKDIYSNVVANATINWTVNSGGGTLSTNTSTTDVSGLTSSTLTLGTTSGTHNVTASLNGTASTVNFTATGTAGAASVMTITSGNNQTATAGSPLPVTLSVSVVDAWGNPVPNEVINWANSVGAGTLGNASSTTDATGVASNSYTLGNAAGSNTVTASVANIAMINQTFNATGIVGAAAQIIKVAGDSQSANLGTGLSTAFSVQVVDAHNNQISGASLDWTTSSGNLTSSSTTTDASGYSTNTLTVGTTAGAQTVTATISGASVSATFNYTATIAAPIGLSGTALATTASLNWSAVTGASNYKIYSSSSSGSGYTLLGTSATNSYSASITATTYYVVTAINSSTESSYSSELSLSPGASSWVKQIGLLSARTYLGNKLNAQGDETCSAMDLDGDDNIYCAGSTSGNLGEINGGATDPVIVKFDSSGNVQWVTQLGAVTKGAVGDNSESAYFTNIKHGADGYLYAVGATEGSIQETNAGQDDIFITKLNTVDGSIVWIRQLGASTRFGTGDNAGHERAWGLAVSGSGLIYISGSTSGAVAEANSGGDDAFVAKFGPDGDLHWIKQFGMLTKASLTGNNSANEVCKSLALNASETILYCGGHTNGDFIETNGGSSKYDMIVIALDTNLGDLAWARQLGAISHGGKSLEDDYCHSVAVDFFGNIYCGGETNGGMGGNQGGGGDAFVVQFDSSGNLLSANQTGSDHYLSSTGLDSCNSLKAIPGTGGVYCGGNTFSDLAGQAGGMDAFVMKIDVAGSITWLEQMGSNYQSLPSQFVGHEGCDSIGINQAGSIVCVGNTSGYVKESNSSQDIFVANFNSGLVTPLKQLGSSYAVTGIISGANASDFCYAFTKDASGNLYCAGSTTGSLAESNAGNSDVVVMKFNSSGVVQWSTQLGQTTIAAYGGEASGFDTCMGITLDDEGNIYCAGATTSSLGETKADPITSDAFIAKFNSAGSLQWIMQFGDLTEYYTNSNNGTDYFSAITFDPVSQYLYATGITKDLLEPNAGSTDIFVMAVDKTGSPYWTRQFGSLTASPGGDNSKMELARSIKVDSNSNLYISGGTEGAMGEANGGGGNPDVLIFSLTSTGGIRWFRQFGSVTTLNGGNNSSYEICNSIALDEAQGRLYCGGMTTGDMLGMSGGLNDAIILSLDLASGSPIWGIQLNAANSLGGDASMDENCIDIKVNTNGDIFCAGHTSGSLGEMNSDSLTDTFVMKMSSSGAVTWISQFGAQTHAVGYNNLWDQNISGIVIDDNGYIFGAGSTYGSTGESNGSSVNNKFDDIFLFKINPDGSF